MRDGNNRSLNYISGHTSVRVYYLQIAEVGLKASKVRQNLSAERGEAARLGHQGESGIAAGVDGATSHGAQVLPCCRCQDVIIRGALSGATVTLQDQISCCENRESDLVLKQVKAFSLCVLTHHSPQGCQKNPCLWSPGPEPLPPALGWSSRSHCGPSRVRSCPQGSSERWS